MREDNDGQFRSVRDPLRRARPAPAVQALVEFAAGACAPKSATNMQGVQIVVKYIDARLTRLHENFNKLAAEALRQAWPCTN
jgi:hypothetical protein